MYPFEKTIFITSKTRKMKTNFTLIALFIAFMLTSAVSKSQTSYQFSFNSIPTITNGGAANQVGTQYRFSNVCTGTDALVTILSATGGATIAIFDDNTNTKPEAFSPEINIPGNQTGLIEFKFEFVKAGLNSISTQDSLYATAIDIDGTSSLKEMDVIDMGGGVASYMAANPEISVTQSGNVFTGKNIAGTTYNGIDTSARQVMFTVKKNNISSFIYKAGAVNSGSSSALRLKCIYFKNFIYPSSALPVKYSAFDAAASNNVVTLRWVTENEINSNHFEVERSFDGYSFKTVGLVLDALVANGSSKTYQFKDNSAELLDKNLVYYRLKQVDNDGRITYSGILAVRMQANANGVKMQVSPNPFVENLSVRFTATENGTAQLQLVNVNGQKVLTQQVTISKGNNSMQMQGFGKLNTGIYLAQLVVNGVIIDNQKIVKN